jgi:hypothetical protein
MVSFELLQEPEQPKVHTAHPEEDGDGDEKVEQTKSGQKETHNGTGAEGALKSGSNTLR